MATLVSYPSKDEDGKWFVIVRKKTVSGTIVSYDFVGTMEVVDEEDARLVAKLLDGIVL